MAVDTFTANADDGQISGNNATYATARSTSTASDDTATTATIGQSLAGTYFVYRYFVRFDTSTIPDDATIDDAELFLTADSDFSTTDFNVQCYRYAWTSTLAANREADYDGAYGGGATLEGTFRATSSGWSSGTQYSMTVDTAGINLSGYTGYTLVSSRDVAGTTPTGNERVLVRTVDHATPGDRPQLTVTYTPAATGQPTTVRLWGIPHARPAGFGGVRIGG